MGNVSKIAYKGFEWNKNIGEFNKEFIKNFDVYSNKGYILKVDRC